MLLESKVVVCAGSGGVGKTTMSSAIAVRATQLGRNTLVLTVDPAKRLANALGLEMGSDSETVVPLEGAPAKLSAAVIDSKRIFDNFIRAHAKQADIVERIMRNRLYHQMSTTLSGSQEFTALERLLQAVESGKYDLVVLDTPPTKHAMDFLTAPQRINSLFQDAITKWFMSPDDKPKGIFASLIGRGTRAVLKSLEVLTGSAFIEELIDFFAAVRSIQSILRERSEETYRLLTSEKTSFVVVTSFDAAKLQEAKYLQRQLQSLGYRLKGVVINRAFPLWLPQEGISQANDTNSARTRVLKFFEQFKDYYSLRYNLYDEFARGLDQSVAVIRIPEYQQDVAGLEDLVELAQNGIGKAN